MPITWRDYRYDGELLDAMASAATDSLLWTPDDEETPAPRGGGVFDVVKSLFAGAAEDVTFGLWRPFHDDVPMSFAQRAAFMAGHVIGFVASMAIGGPVLKAIGIGGRLGVRAAAGGAGAVFRLARAGKAAATLSRIERAAKYASLLEESYNIARVPAKLRPVITTALNNAKWGMSAYVGSASAGMALAELVKRAKPDVYNEWIDRLAAEAERNVWAKRNLALLDPVAFVERFGEDPFWQIVHDAATEYGANMFFGALSGSLTHLVIDPRISRYLGSAGEAYRDFLQRMSEAGGTFSVEASTKRIQELIVAASVAPKFSHPGVVSTMESVLLAASVGAWGPAAKTALALLGRSVADFGGTMFAYMQAERMLRGEPPTLDPRDFLEYAPSAVAPVLFSAAPIVVPLSIVGARRWTMTRYVNDLKRYYPDLLDILRRDNLRDVKVPVRLGYSLARERLQKAVRSLMMPALIHEEAQKAGPAYSAYSAQALDEMTAFLSGARAFFTTKPGEVKLGELGASLQRATQVAGSVEEVAGVIARESQALAEAWKSVFDGLTREERGMARLLASPEVRNDIAGLFAMYSTGRVAASSPLDVLRNLYDIEGKGPARDFVEASLRTQVHAHAMDLVVGAGEKTRLELGDGLGFVIRGAGPVSLSDDVVAAYRAALQDSGLSKLPVAKQLAALVYARLKRERLTGADLEEWYGMKPIERVAKLEAWFKEFVEDYLEKGLAREPELAEAAVRVVDRVLTRHTEVLERVSKLATLNDLLRILRQEVSVRVLDDVAERIKRGEDVKLAFLWNGREYVGRAVGLLEGEQYGGIVEAGISGEGKRKRKQRPVGAFRPVPIAIVEVEEPLVGAGPEPARYRVYVRLYEQIVPREGGDPIAVPSVVAVQGDTGGIADYIADRLREVMVRQDELPDLLKAAFRKRGTPLFTGVSRGSEAQALATDGLVRFFYNLAARYDNLDDALGAISDEPFDFFVQTIGREAASRLTIRTDASGRPLPDDRIADLRNFVNDILSSLAQARGGDDSTVVEATWRRGRGRGERPIRVPLGGLREFFQAARKIHAGFTDSEANALLRIWDAAVQHLAPQGAPLDALASSRLQWMYERLLYHTAEIVQSMDLPPGLRARLQQATSRMAQVIQKPLQDQAQDMRALAAALASHPMTAWAIHAAVGGVVPRDVRLSASAVLDADPQLAAHAQFMETIGPAWEITELLRGALADRTMVSKFILSAAYKTATGHLSASRPQYAEKTAISDLGRAYQDMAREMEQSETPLVQWTGWLADSVFSASTLKSWPTLDLVVKQAYDFNRRTYLANLNMLALHDYAFPLQLPAVFLERAGEKVAKAFKQALAFAIKPELERRGLEGDANAVLSAAHSYLATDKALWSDVLDQAGMPSIRHSDKLVERIISKARGLVSRGEYKQAPLQAVVDAFSEVVAQEAVKHTRDWFTELLARTGYKYRPETIQLERKLPRLGLIEETSTRVPVRGAPPEAELGGGFWQHPLLATDQLFEKMIRLRSPQNLIGAVLRQWREWVTAFSPKTRSNNVWTNALNLFALARWENGPAPMEGIVQRYLDGLVRLGRFDDFATVAPDFVVARVGSLLGRFGEPSFWQVLAAAREAADAALGRKTKPVFFRGADKFLTFMTEMQNRLYGLLGGAAGTYRSALRAGVNPMEVVLADRRARGAHYSSFGRPELQKLEYLLSDSALHLSVLGDIINEVEARRGRPFSKLADALNDGEVKALYMDARRFLPDYSRYEPQFLGQATAVLPFMGWRLEAARIYSFAWIEKPIVAMSLFAQTLQIRTFARMMAALAAIGGVLSRGAAEETVEGLVEETYQMADFLSSWGVVELPMVRRFVNPDGSEERTLFYVNLGPAILAGDYIPRSSPYRMNPVMPLLEAGSSLMGPLPRIVSALGGYHVWGTRFIEPGDTVFESGLKKAVVMAAAISPQVNFFMDSLREILTAVRRQWGPQEPLERLAEEKAFWSDVLRRARVLGEPKLSENVLVEVLGRLGLSVASATLGPTIVAREESPVATREYYSYILRELKRQRSERLSELYDKLRERFKSGKPTDAIEHEIADVWRAYTSRIAWFQVVDMVADMGDTGLLERAIRELPF